MACSQPSGNGPKLLFELVCCGFGANEANYYEEKIEKKRKTKERKWKNNHK